ncbi:MAG TPA: MgtC/SapB family protein [Caulifigura sp.]|jgi:putative Mg2+ transporter-C (MgtC) family protein|nr:MgtC/SapB family protein [Caulifigura sp.]
MDNLWQGLLKDFSDVPSLAEVLRIAVRLLVAALLGGVLGYERAKAGKSAGLRTHMLVALGSALFALIPSQAGMKLEDMSRVVQGIVTGIGFIGAGSILKHSATHEVHGLTTAAGLWLTAAIGMAAGLGREVTAILGTVLAFAVLSLLPEIEVKGTGEPAAKSHEA